MTKPLLYTVCANWYFPAEALFLDLYICRGFGTEVISITRTISRASCRCCNRCIATRRGSSYWRSIHWAHFANVQWHLWRCSEWWSFSSSPELQSHAVLAHRYVHWSLNLLYDLAAWSKYARKIPSILSLQTYSEHLLVSTLRQENDATWKHSGGMIKNVGESQKVFQALHMISPL